MIRRPPRSTPLSLHDALPIWKPPGERGPSLHPKPTATSARAAVPSGRISSRTPRAPTAAGPSVWRSEEHTSELQSQSNLVCRLLLEKKIAESKYRDIALHLGF